MSIKRSTQLAAHDSSVRSSLPAEMRDPMHFFQHVSVRLDMARQYGLAHSGSINDNAVGRQRSSGGRTLRNHGLLVLLHDELLELFLVVLAKLGEVEVGVHGARGSDDNRGGGDWRQKQGEQVG